VPSVHSKGGPSAAATPLAPNIMTMMSTAVDIRIVNTFFFIFFLLFYLFLWVAVKIPLPVFPIGSPPFIILNN
jgi:hypothetical protein